MNIRKLLLPLLAFSAISTQAFSYVVYNNAPFNIRLIDVNLGGMDKQMSANSSTACSPEARGCYGNMGFVVYSPTGFRHLCGWTGVLPQGRGYYFVITPTNNPYPYAACKMELFHE
jgi:hypothetical protein